MTRRCLLWTPLVSAAVAGAQDAKAKQVVAEALEALGGDRYLAMEDRLEQGRAYSFYNQQLSGLSIARIYTRHLGTVSDKGLATREKQVFGKDQDNSVLFNENGEGWEITFRGARPLPPQTLTRYVDSTPRNVLYLMRHRLREKGMIIESMGSEVLINEPVNVVEFTDANNKAVTAYFHYSTKLPIRQKFFRRDPQTKERFEEVTLFSKYRNVGGGVRWPYVMRRERDGEKIYEIFSEKVTINNGFDDKQFTLPAGIKMV